MGSLINAGSTLTAGQANGDLNQYYGLADTSLTTVTGTSLANLSTPYTIPAGEPVAGSAYELCCGGDGQQGSTAQTLTLEFWLGSSQVGVGPVIGSDNFATSAHLRWGARFIVTCVAAGSGATWYGSMTGCITQTDNNVIVGTADNNTVPFADSNATAHTASTTSTITAVLQAVWGSASGSPTISNRWTTFRKIS